MEEKKGVEDKFMDIDKFITQLIGFHEQIKELKASEIHYKELAERLQETVNKYQIIITHLPQKVFLKDKSLFYLFSSENYARLFGVAPQEILGKTDHDFYPFEVAEQRLNDDRMFLAKGQPEEKEERVLRDGKERVERVVKYPIKNESGEVIGIIGISWDITAKKEKEEELERKNKELAALLEIRNAELKEIREKFQWEQVERQRLEERLQNVEALFPILFENTGTAVAMIKENKIISRVNREFEKLSGYSRAEVEGTKNWGEFIRNGSLQDIGEPAGSPSMNSLGPGIPVFKFLGRQDEERTVSMTVALIPDTGSVLVSLKDITNYEKAREELNRVMAQFRQLMVEMENAAKDLHG